MKRWPWYLLAIVVILLDQASKYYATLMLNPYDPVPVMPMLNMTLAYNTGAAFSFLSGAGDWHRWFFAGFSATVSLVLIVALYRCSPSDKLQKLALSLILGGAIGNLYDRAFMGYVVDFIDVYYKNHHWPIFNVADSAICVGAALLTIDLTRNAVR